MSCLFDSLSRWIPKGGNEIRQMVCDYLEADNMIMEGMRTAEILMTESPYYIEWMRLNTTMGGAIELQAVCNIWNVSVIVHNIQHEGAQDMEFLPVCADADVETIIHLTWDGGHYECGVLPSHNEPEDCD